MWFKEPKNTKEISWTKHAIRKMRFYGLSESRLRVILRNPCRREEGIAPKTIAVMQRTGSKKHPTEIWMMLKENIKSKSKNGKLLIISAWRYPGITKKGQEVPIPEEALVELNKSN